MPCMSSRARAVTCCWPKLRLSYVLSSFTGSVGVDGKYDMPLCAVIRQNEGPVQWVLIIVSVRLTSFTHLFIVHFVPAVSPPLASITIKLCITNREFYSWPLHISLRPSTAPLAGLLSPNLLVISIIRRFSTLAIGTLFLGYLQSHASFYAPSITAYVCPKYKSNSVRSAHSPIRVIFPISATIHAA